MKKLILILCVLISSLSYAQGLKVEPLYSFEKSYRVYPQPGKTVTRAYLGLRATYGTALLSGEFEVAQSSDSDFFADSGETVKYEAQRAMLGVKSYPFKSQYVGMFFRAGIRAKKEKRSISGGTGIDRTEEGDITIDPYAGTGLTIAISNVFALNAGATLVYNKDAPSGDRFDQQLTLSFSFKAGNR